MRFWTERMMVVNEAISWLKTPHHHQGRVKGAYDSGSPGGVDCFMLIAEVYSCAGLIPPLPQIEYSRDGHLHRDNEVALPWLQQYAFQIEIEEILPGDMVAYKYGRRFSHGALVIIPGWPRIIHAVLDQYVQYGNGEKVSSAGHRPDGRLFYRFNGWRS